MSKENMIKMTLENVESMENKQAINVVLWVKFTRLGNIKKLKRDFTDYFPGMYVKGFWKPSRPFGKYVVITCPELQDIADIIRFLNDLNGKEYIV